MSDSHVDTAEIRSQLIQEFCLLPPLEEKIIQLFSVIYEPVNRTSFLECFNLIGARDTNDKPFTNSKLKPYIDNLLAAGLLIQEREKPPQCHPLLVEIATRSAVKSGCFAGMAKTVEDKLPIRTYYTDGPKIFQNKTQLLREVRLGIYNQDIQFINKQLEDYQRYGHQQEKISATGIFEQVCSNPFDADWCRTLPLSLYENILPCILLNSILTLSPATEAFTLLKAGCSQPGEHSSDYLQMILAEQLLLRGYLQETQQCLSRISENYQNNAAAFWGWFYFLKGDNDKAIESYTIALKHLKQAKNKKKTYFNIIMINKLVAEFLGTMFFLYVILATGDAVAIGLALMAVIFILGKVSGGNFNPAVSVMLAASGQLSMHELAPYVVAQVAGGLAAFELY
ncbi:MAG: aquaporin, partial [Rivularia sp. ALOHA_DT_140]|nr:aquaporin [Rivularia sp. ALOHA_DT_140]